MLIVRWAIVLFAALLVALFAVRNAAVQAWAERDPLRAVSAWPGHPDAEISLGMIEIAEAMRDRRPVSPSIVRRVQQAALRAPLAPEPFLVHGVRADLAGDSLAAERDFAAAQRRDPRSLAAAYFLADRYVRRGDVAHGLTQLALLARLAPGGALSVAPYLANYAAKPANWPQLRALFRAEPALGDAALQALATHPASAPAILALADARQRSPSAPWLQTLLARLVEARDYGQARSIWAAVSRVQVGPGTLLFNGSFAESVAPPPFNWELSSSTAGLAERRPGGGLHVMFYSQEDGMLARQLLVLPPGSYRLSLSVQPGSSNAESLYWTVRCAAGNAELGRVRLDQAASGWTFQVPASCPAQWLELVGSAPDVPRQSDVTIANLSLIQGSSR